jgi:Zn-dependent metalloprotease
MNPTHCWDAICGIVPPNILEAIAIHGDPQQRAWALQTLAIDTTLRSARMSSQSMISAAAGPSMQGVTPHKQRMNYTANHGSSLPGTLVRSEGQGPTSDAAVDEAYDGHGATFDLYWTIFKRNSIDNNGMDLIGTVHYGQNYDNAFWNGAQMVYGDGDGSIFNRFTIAIDVMGHELTHGVTAHQANLAYHDQPGALNESVSDCFGSMVKQFAHSPQQTSAQADWLIGAGLFTPRIHGVALRSMKAPGTAYDDPLLGGKDPQPAHMSNYDHRTSDNGGVHINSGIPNHAFYLAAVAFGGYSWEKAGPIWYATICDPRLSANAQFQDFANITADNALKLFGAAEQQGVISAWQQVGINVTGAGPGIAGNWVLHYSWGCTGSYASVNITFNSSGTFTGGVTGKWVQQDGTILLGFDSGPAKYAGNLDGNVGTGAMSTFTGLDGCWYLSKQGTTGLEPERAVGRAGPIDVAGNQTSSRS